MEFQVIVCTEPKRHLKILYQWLVYINSCPKYSFIDAMYKVLLTDDES